MGYRESTRQLSAMFAHEAHLADTFDAYVRVRAGRWRRGECWGDARFQRREARAQLRLAEWAASNAGEVWGILVDVALGLPAPLLAPGGITTTLYTITLPFFPVEVATP